MRTYGGIRLALVVTAAVVVVASPTGAHHKPGHVGDVVVAPTSDGFATGIFIPGGGDGGDDTRSTAAACKGCSWARVPSCDGNGFRGYDPVTGAELWDDHDVCPRFTSCQNGGGRWDIYLRRAGESWYARVGDVCLRPGDEIRSGAELAAAVRERFEDAVPTNTFAVQPAGVQVVNVPTIFYVEEQPVAFPPHSVGGITVQITPRVDYYWRYDAAAGFEGPTGPGAPYPDHDVSHAFRTPGRRTVTLRAVWTATFTAFGHTFDVPGEVVRETTATVDVREARARLEGG